MTRLLAEDLFLLCWDDEKGSVRQRCSSTLAPGIGGALVIDALLAEALTVADDRVQATGSDPGDPLLAEVVAEAESRRAPTVQQLVKRMGDSQRQDAVRDRLVAGGVLRADKRRLFGIFPTTRYPLADPAAAARVRDSVRALVTGQRDSDSADVRDVVLAGLAKPTNAIDELVDRSERKAANQRAESFAQGQGVPEAVGKAVRDAQAAAMAAITTVITASTTTATNAGSR